VTVSFHNLCFRTAVAQTCGGIRRVERVDAELYNVELEKCEAVKNPIEAAQK
jgi:hypothetical protein